MDLMIWLLGVMVGVVSTALLEVTVLRVRAVRIDRRRRRLREAARAVLDTYGAGS